VKAVFIGDSVTDCGRFTDPEHLGEGYVRLLAESWATSRPDVTVINTGTSGHRVPDLEGRVQADVVGQLLHLIFGNGDGRADLVVRVVLERDDGVEAVVPAGELQHDQHGVLRTACVGRSRGERRAAEERRDRGPEPEQGRVFEEGAANHGRLRFAACGVALALRRKRRSIQLEFRQRQDQVGDGP
jgi:hypothetical protein